MRRRLTVAVTSTRGFHLLRYLVTRQELEIFKERSTLSVDSKIKSGKYLPSSVWETKGWDKKLIEDRVQDWVMHPVLGCKCFNVETLAKRSEETEQEKMSTAMRASVTVPRGGRRQGAWKEGRRLAKEPRGLGTGAPRPVDRECGN